MSIRTTVVQWDSPLVCDAHGFPGQCNIKIAAIKAVRKATQCGLKTAKDFVEAAMEGSVAVTYAQMHAINHYMVEDRVSAGGEWGYAQLTAPSEVRSFDWSYKLDEE